jgi:DNA-3-methyladenine glycosylase II
VKGIGTWTAEMFLIFTMGRQNVFSIGDLGLRNAITRHYGALTTPEMILLSDTWSPYRSYASLVLWKSLDNDVRKS